MRGIAEHFTDRNRQQLQQLHERCRVVEHLLLQRRNGGALELAQRVVDATLDRRTGIIAKVVAVLEVNRLDQQAQFDFAIALPGINAFH
ncbi:hypothetical protein D3C86_2009880 [compost metagenome]